MKKYLNEVLKKKMEKMIGGCMESEEEYHKIKEELMKIREKKAKRALESMKITKIQDHIINLNKREQMKKRSQQNSMEELEIDGHKHKGLDDILEGLEKKLREDMKETKEWNERDKVLADTLPNDHRNLAELLPKYSGNRNE